MAARPFNISASGEKKANFSFLTPLKIGIKEAAANMMKANKIDGSASPTCWKIVSPEEASAPKAAMKPSMAKRPLMVSGPEPEKAMVSPKVTSFLAGGGGGGGGVAELPSGAEVLASGSGAARTTTLEERETAKAGLTVLEGKAIFLAKVIEAIVICVCVCVWKALKRANVN